MKNILFTTAIISLLTPFVFPHTTTAQSADYYRCPMDIPIYLSANFAEIRTNRFHTGIDIKTEGVVGKPLYAAADGYIARVTVAPTGYGRALYIAHPNGTTTVYAHMDRFTLEVEQYLRAERYRLKRSDLDCYPAADRFPVRRGEVIGAAGNSGSSTGPHLHYEVRQSSTSRTLNVMARGWVTTAATDRTPPRIARLYHVDIDTIAGVPVHSRPRAYDVRQNADGSWSLVRTAPLKAGPTSYFVIETTDRRGDVANTFGIHRARMSVDGDERVLFEKDGVLFEEVRNACASVLYETQRKTGNEVVMLAVRDGNRLGMYKKAVDRGVIRFPGAREIPLLDKEGGQPKADGVVENTSRTSPKTISITVEDDAGNTSMLNFAVEPDALRTTPERPQGVVASNRSDFSHAANGLTVTIPRGALYEPIFYTQSVVNVAVTPRTDSIRPLSPLHRTGAGYEALHSAMRIGIGAEIPENIRPKACLAKVADNGSLSYAGGKWVSGSYTGGAWAGGGVNGTTRDFGTYCVVADTVAPTVRVSFASGGDLSKTASVTITATDNFSGIASFSGTIDGEWIIFERHASRGQFVHKFDSERLATGRTHTLEFICRDGVGNRTVLSRTFFK
jgi:murein DD-endopeptidase MepM/ murein hydrolase activator NlpD